MPFKKIGLCDELVQGILATGYTAPTEVQAEAIPLGIAGKDMICCAQTGTGKTAAFVLPILNRIALSGKKTKNKKVRSLIITPTRELAMQINESVRGYGRFIKMRSIAIYGGSPMDKQIKALKSGVDVVAATPGRLLDHIQRGTINLSSVEILVLDEADRMLDMGFIKDIKKILEQISPNRQTMLFSATISKGVTALTQNILRSPKMVQIGTQHNPIDLITQHIFPVTKDQKLELLLCMLKRQQMYSVLVFSRTKRGADRICRKLRQHDIKAEAIHSDRTQRQRLRSLEGFKSGKYKVMVATDIAARGINVTGISHVFNYDVPGYPEDYVHRIGRTGRAEATGDAITFVCSDEIQQIRDIEKFIGKKFKAEYYEDFDYKLHITLSSPAMSRGKGRGRSQSGQQRNRPQSKRGPQSGKPKPKANRYAKKKNAASAKHTTAKTGERKGQGSAESKKSFKPKPKPKLTRSGKPVSYKKSTNKKRKP